jgi:protein-arginine kinase activator protein McsA
MKYDAEWEIVTCKRCLKTWRRHFLSRLKVCYACWEKTSPPPSLAPTAFYLA